MEDNVGDYGHDYENSVVSLSSEEDSPLTYFERRNPSLTIDEDQWLIAVDLSQQTLFVYRGRELRGTYPISTGKGPDETPRGVWVISEKITDPGPGTQFGTRWMRLDRFDPLTGDSQRTDYGIHGTDEEDQIGTPVSAGCVRMFNQQIEEVFRWVPLGTLVMSY